MPDYDLTRLGSRAFEQLVVALARQDIGPGVQVFGDGRDGGREATFEGTINWSKTSAGDAGSLDSWSGYTVLQAKFHVKPGPAPRDNATWLQGQIRDEINGWIKAAEGETRLRLPDYLIFVTNVDLSAVAKVGGIDKVNRAVKKWLTDSDAVRSGLRVKDFAIWHADQIRSMLDASHDVRCAFPALLTAGDVLQKLSPDWVSLGSFDAQDPLREQLLHAIKADRWIRLSQSGGPGEAKLWLDDVAIDLPATLASPGGDLTVQAVQRVLELGDMVLRQRQPDRIGRSNIVLVGGPGQGKSTLSQLIAQAYRVALLTDAHPGPSVQEVIDGTRAALDRLGLPVPGNRRWPVRIDLAKYAEELGSGADVSLLRWVSTRMSEHTDRQIPPSALRGWLRAWPWALILDGLDEVPSVDARRLIYSKIDDLLTSAEDLDADLLIVVTTRPTGYEERFPAGRFEHLQLQRLPADEASAFAQQITDKRFTGDDEMRIKVARRMHDAAHDPVTIRLMETPLQVTIMSFIVEKFPTLPPDRFTLFNMYYQTMFDREVAKDIPIARFLSQHRTQIDRLHEQIGLFLQAASETADGAEATISPGDLHNVALQRLLDRGFTPDEAETNAGALVEAATHRLVLLGPRDNGVGFDIRTLQELMAARAIAEGDDAAVTSRLRLIAHHPHWRNTWLLAVGQLLLRSERFEKRILDLLKQLDSDPHRLNARYPTAPALAADMLDDNLAAKRPRFELGLIERLLSSLDRPPVVDVPRLATTLRRIAKTDRHRRLVYERISSAASAGAARRAASVLMLEEMAVTVPTNDSQLTTMLNTYRALGISDTEVQAIGTWQKVSARSLSPSHAGGSEVYFRLIGNITLLSDPGMETVSLPDCIEERVEPIGLSPEDLEVLRTGLTALSDSRFHLLGPPPGTAVPASLLSGPVEPLVQALENEDVATALDLALSTLPSTHWAIEAMLGATFKPSQNRQAVGHRLRHAITEDTATDNSYTD
ncbi:NACHT domain-containing protein [Streptomyces noboritoensis]|uniref:NACHT domain-containing protein n=1 Tax=Streptomyces noboritoensis TaxID=67337 RepID=A0ABV6TGG6_9ACTN